MRSLIASLLFVVTGVGVVAILVAFFTDKPQSETQTYKQDLSGFDEGYFR